MGVKYQGKPRGRKPEVREGNFERMVTVRAPSTTHARIAEASERQGKSMNRYLVDLIEAALKLQLGPPAPPPVTKPVPDLVESRPAATDTPA